MKNWSISRERNQNGVSLQAVAQRCSVKRLFLEISQNSQENICARVSFLIKLQAIGLRPATLKKEALAQVFFCEFCEICKRSFFYKTPPVAASVSFSKHADLEIVSFTKTDLHRRSFLENLEKFSVNWYCFELLPTIFFVLLCSEF